jgi:hypothetical protein
MSSSIPNREPNDDEPLANFGSLEALIMPLLQMLQGGESGGMGVQGQAPAGADFFPRGNLDSLRGLLEGGTQNVSAVPHYRQQLRSAAGGDPRDTTPKKNVHFS